VESDISSRYKSYTSHTQYVYVYDYNVEWKIRDNSVKTLGTYVLQHNSQMENYYIFGC